jgi:hypothetical protein
MLAYVAANVGVLVGLGAAGVIRDAGADPGSFSNYIRLSFDAIRAARGSSISSHGGTAVTLAVGVVGRALEARTEVEVAVPAQVLKVTRGRETLARVGRLSVGVAARGADPAALVGLVGTASSVEVVHIHVVRAVTLVVGTLALALVHTGHNTIVRVAAAALLKVHVGTEVLLTALPHTGGAIFGSLEELSGHAAATDSGVVSGEGRVADRRTVDVSSVRVALAVVSESEISALIVAAVNVASGNVALTDLAVEGNKELALHLAVNGLTNIVALTTVLATDVVASVRVAPAAIRRLDTLAEIPAEELPVLVLTVSSDHGLTDTVVGAEVIVGAALVGGLLAHELVLGATLSEVAATVFRDGIGVIGVALVNLLAAQLQVNASSVLVNFTDAAIDDSTLILTLIDCTLELKVSFAVVSASLEANASGLLLNVDVALITVARKLVAVGGSIRGKALAVGRVAIRHVRVAGTIAVEKEDDTLTGGVGNTEAAVNNGTLGFALILGAVELVMLGIGTGHRFNRETLTVVVARLVGVALRGGNDAVEVVVTAGVVSRDTLTAGGPVASVRLAVLDRVLAVEAKINTKVSL